MTTSSRSIQHGSPSFFKVIRDPSSPHLMLPSAFVRRHMEQIPKNPVLKTLTGEHSWRLEIEKIDGDYCFALGWNKLVQDFNLCLGDFLVFWLIDSSTFKVLIFHRDGCEKDPNWEPGINIDDDDEDGGDELLDDDDDDEEEEEDVDYVYDGIRDENPCFQRAISEKTHKYTMRLPRVFVEEAGIKNKSVVTIKDLKGREWLVGLFVERFNSNKYILASGWSIFREYNNLSEGDICLFKFIKKESVLYLAQLIKNKNARKENFRERKTVKVDGVKKKRGRPPLEKPRGNVKDDVVKIEDESDLEVEVVKRKRGRPPLEKRDGGVGVVNTQMDADKREKDKSIPEKRVCGVDDGFNTEMEVEKRKRGRPSLEKRGGGGGGGGDVKTEVEVEKRKRGRPSLEKLGGGDGVNTETGVEKRNRGRPPLEKHSGGGGGGGDVKTEVEVEKRKRGRPPLKKRKRGRPPLEKCRGGGGVNNTQMEVEKKKKEKSPLEKPHMGRPPLEKCRGGGGVDTEMEVEKKKREKPPLEKPHMDVKVKDESSLDIEVIKRERGRPSLKKPCVEVKIEDESTSDVEATRRKRGSRVIYF